MKEDQNEMGLPMSWTWVKLRDTGKIISGGTPSTAIGEYWNGSINWISPSDLTGYKKKTITKGAKSITELGLKNSSARLMPKGSVLFSSRAPIGYVVITADIACTNQGFKSISPNENVLSEFLYYFLLASKRNAEQVASGTTFKEISLTKFAELDFPLPPKPIQQSIISKIEELFSELDKGIENLLTVQQQLKTYRQSVLKWAFEGRLTNDDVKEGELPEGWKWMKIDEVTISLDNKRQPINKEERLKRQGDIPYYGANGRVGWINDYIFNEPLICVVEDETFTGREIPFSYKIVGKSWVNNHAHVLKPKDDLNIDFLNYQLYYYPFLRLTTGTTGRKKLTKNALMSAPIRVCSIKEQCDIVQEIERRLSVANKMQETITQSLQQSEALRQSILKLAFEGRLV